MNIAILFFGQLRWYPLANQTFIQNLKPALEEHNIQYFAHFWNDQFLDEFKQLYNPISVKIESQKPIPEIKEYFNNTSNKISDNLPSQLYSLHQSYLLLDKEYDLYIKIRTDLAILDKVILNFNDNSVYVNSTERSVSEYVKDFILFTKSHNNIKKVAEMGFHLDSTIRNLDHQNRNLYYHEEILADYLKTNNIDIKIHNFNVDLARHH